jgi:protease I
MKFNNNYIRLINIGLNLQVNKKSILIFLPSLHFSGREFFTIKRILEENNINTFIASDSSFLCISETGQKVKADVSLFNIHENNFSGIVFIGGSGAKNYWDNSLLHKIAVRFNKSKKIIGAICSAPIILARAGILNGITSTCFYENRMELINNGIDYKDMPVILKGNIITADGPNSSKFFTESIVDLLSRQN